MCEIDSDVCYIITVFKTVKILGLLASVVWQYVLEQNTVE
jgi:hypothetical protein